MRVVIAGVAGVVIAVAAAACARMPSESTGIPDYPTLEPDDRPIDPYASDDVPRTLASWEAGELQEVIPVDVDVGDPRVVEAMVVRIRARVLRVPSAPNQQVTTDKAGIQRVATRVGPGATATRAARDAALAPTPAIDSDHALVREVAREAVRGERNPRRRVAKLVAWIDEHVTYEITDQDRASTILASRTGDCNEQSLLFIAMARAVGIPARRVVGLVPAPQDRSAFGLHAWAEVALDGRWVAVDPTWNEPVADAAHITLAVGAADDAHLHGDELEDLAMAVVDVTRRPGGVDDPRALARDLPVHLRLQRRR